MRHITPSDKTTISSEKGKLKITINDYLDREKKEAFMSLVDEILEDLHGTDFNGNFSFDKTHVEITLESGGDKKTWTRNWK